MWTVLIIARLVILSITGVCGTFLNSIIVVLNFRSWRDVATSKSYNKILFVIGLINSIIQVHINLDTIFETFHVYLLSRNLLVYTFTFCMILISINVWNTTWLSIFCCVRLFSSSNWFFLRMKVKFLSSLPLLIVGSILVSSAINLPLFWTTKVEIPQNTTSSPISGYKMTMDYHCIVFVSLFDICLPVSMSCVSIGLSVTTLVGHIRRMGSSDSHLTSAQLQGHYRAVWKIVIRVFLDFFFYTVVVIGTSVEFLLNSPVMSYLWMTVLLYPTSQASILILGNPKLRSAVYGLMRSFR
ncbi:hypothetical protein PRIEUP_LOCUS156 [Pristimantis euphronides]